MYSPLPVVDEIDFANLREQVLSYFPNGNIEMNIWINQFENKNNCYFIFINTLFLDISGRVDFVFQLHSDVSKCGQRNRGCYGNKSTKAADTNSQGVCMKTS